MLILIVPSSGKLLLAASSDGKGASEPGAK